MRFVAFEDLVASVVMHFDKDEERDEWHHLVGDPHWDFAVAGEDEHITFSSDGVPGPRVGPRICAGLWRAP